MNDNGWITSSQIVHQVNISLRQLYYWELKGIIQPKLITMGSREFKRYSQRDVEILKLVKRHLDRGYTLAKAMEIASDHNRTNNKVSR